VVCGAHPKQSSRSATQVRHEGRVDMSQRDEEIEKFSPRRWRCSGRSDRDPHDAVGAHRHAAGTL